MTTSSGRLRGVVLVASLGWAALAAAPAFKHTHLKRSDPMADSTVAEAPAAIRLWFSEPIQIRVTTVRVTSADSATVTTARPRLGTGAEAPVIADVQGVMAPGRYTVAWRTMSRDGHPVAGTFAFTLAAPAAHNH